MNAATDPKTLSQEELFELLEQPERWPDDPALQAELAAMLEVDLALRAHAQDIKETIQPQTNVRAFHSHWLMAAAAVLLAVVPSMYAIYRFQHTRQMAKDTARIEQDAQRRGQARLWGDFFQQSSQLIREFTNRPASCEIRKEDRSEERELATTLLQASNQLAGLGAPKDIAEAEAIRTNLHAWFTELSLEEGCIEPARAEELRQWAKAHSLEEEAKRLGQLMSREGN
jgi:hypothetical protein